MGNYKIYTKKNYPSFGLEFQSVSIPGTKAAENVIPLIEVQPGSPAEHAGIQNLQCVTAINGKVFTKDFKSIEDIVKYLKQCYLSKDSIEVTSIDLEQWYEFIESLDPKQSRKAYFKRCFIRFAPGFEGFGFVLNSKIRPKYSIVEIDADSPVSRANLKVGDIIIEIDGKNIRQMEFKQVKKLLDNSYDQGQVEILAISKKHYIYYKDKNENFSDTQFTSAARTKMYHPNEASESLALQAEVPSNEVSILKEDIKRLQEKINNLKLRSDCAICLETLSDQTCVTPCGHLFCTKCLRVMFSTKYEILCPTCRNSVFSAACYPVFF